MAPYATAGGLGEVGKSLPMALIQSEEVEVRRVMPYYKSLQGRMKYYKDFIVPMGEEGENCILRTNPEQEDVITYFIDNARYFYRDTIYGYDDDGIRFFFFCRAIIEMLKIIPYKPDIIHTNDWHTGFLPLLIKAELNFIKSVYTIHNIAYHGFVPAKLLGIKITQEEMITLGYPEWLNFMKAGILYADLVTTVSPGYAEEILDETKSSGMAMYLEQRKSNKMVGVLNGIDMKSYDPYLDGVQPYPYQYSTISRKKNNKTLLREEYGFENTELPLISMVTRLDFSKGIDLIPEIFESMDTNRFQMLILGSGNEDYEKLLTDLSTKYPGVLKVDFRYTPEKAKKIYGASDIYLMPSQFEPCGMGQLYSMRYGTVPVVNPVGGLKDTVIDNRNNTKTSTGFYMDSWNSNSLIKALDRALQVYGTTDWTHYMKNCMEFDSSWKPSVKEYCKLYQKLIQS